MTAFGLVLRTQSDIARETIRQLAIRKLMPTPENYADIYRELSGGTAPESSAVLQWLKQFCVELGRIGGMRSLAALERALLNRDADQARMAILGLCQPEESRAQPDWPQLVRDLLREWDARQSRWTQARKRESLEHVLGSFGGDPKKLSGKLASLIRAWSERGGSGGVNMPLAVLGPEVGSTPASYLLIEGVPDSPTRNPVTPIKSMAGAAASVQPSPGPGAGSVKSIDSRDEDTAYTMLRDLAAELLDLTIGTGQHCDERLVVGANGVIAQLRAAATPADFARLLPAVQELRRLIERAQGTQRDTLRGLLSLLHLIVENIEELVPDGRWVKGQIEKIRCMIAVPVDSHALAEAEQAFLDVIARQGAIRKRLEEAKAALKDMLSTFIQRLGAMCDSTGDYQNKIQTYAVQIENADDIAQLPGILKELLGDTRQVQADMVRTRDDLLQARQQASAYENQISHLERELADVSSLLKADQLTGVLNRRGLNEAFEVESARSDRSGEPLTVALLDVDNFKLLNDTHGHAVGDRALQHLAEVVRKTVRPTDVVARYGGEEFVVVLPNTGRSEAADVMARVQRQLTRVFFLLHNERLLITFSAGVTQRHPGEGQPEVLTRADRALYLAKGSGKNKVVCI